MTTPVGQNPTPPANGSLPPSPPTSPSSSLKRPRSEPPATPDSDLIPSSKRQKTTEWVVLDENCGDFRLIPDEIVHRILSNFNASTLLTVGITCKRFLYLADRAPMWEELCLDAKLSLEKVDSFRLAFLSAIEKENPDAYISKADFFLTGKYTEVNQEHALACKTRALACLDHAINMETFSKNGVFSERQVEIVLKKEALFLNNMNFARSAFAPGQILITFEQLKHVIKTCPSQDQAARAGILNAVMSINDTSRVVSYSSIWNTFHKIRLDEQVSDQVRKTAKYMLSILKCQKPQTRWARPDFTTFHQSNRDLPAAERAKILKECIADQTALPWCRELAKTTLAFLQLKRAAGGITDKEAFEMLEPLKNSFSQPSGLNLVSLESLMEQFRAQNRV